MKKIAGLMCLGSVCASALWIEYQSALLLGTGCFLLAVRSSLTLWLLDSIGRRTDMSDATVLTYGRGIAGARLFVTSDSLNHRVPDNETEVAAGRLIPTEHS